MKCDVCGTKIPLGKYECPNCGYRLRKSNVHIYDASGKTHEHIQSTQQKSYVPPKRNVESDKWSNLVKNKQTLLGALFSALVIILLVAFIAVPMFMDTYVNPYEDKSFAEIIAAGDDENGSVQMASKYKTDLNSFMTKMKFDGVDINEYVDDYDGQMTATITGVGKKDDVSYTITLSYDGIEQVNGSVRVSYYTDQSIRYKKSLEIDKKLFDGIISYIGVTSASQITEPYLSKMKLAEDTSVRLYEYTSTLTSPYVYMSEEYKEDEKLYYHFISIDQYT